ncbi:MAG: hypothetical protein J7485_11750 [Sphingobium sp.]|nr:hypothetical protein [Sphingobium sp.]
MATAVNRGVAARGFQPSFHLWMTLLMAAFVFTGFGMTYIGPLLAGTFRPAPPIVHLHGIVLFSWMVLLVTQSLLVNARNVRLHRSLGTFGISIGTLVVVLSGTMQIVGASITTLKGSGPGVFFLGFVAPPSFAILFAMAIRAVRTPEIHRNLMLIATVSILMPGINRVYMKGVGLPYVPFFLTYLTMDIMLALVLWHERKMTGRISRTTWIGAAIVFVPQLFLKLVSSQPWWSELVYFMGSLVYYRHPAV